MFIHKVIVIERLNVIILEGDMILGIKFIKFIVINNVLNGMNNSINGLLFTLFIINLNVLFIFILIYLLFIQSELLFVFMVIIMIIIIMFNGIILTLESNIENIFIIILVFYFLI